MRRWRTGALAVDNSGELPTALPFDHKLHRLRLPVQLQKNQPKTARTSAGSTSLRPTSPRSSRTAGVRLNPSLRALVPGVRHRWNTVRDERGMSVRHQWNAQPLIGMPNSMPTWFCPGWSPTSATPQAARLVSQYLRLLWRESFSSAKSRIATVLVCGLTRTFDCTVAGAFLHYYCSKRHQQQNKC